MDEFAGLMIIASMSYQRGITNFSWLNKSWDRIAIEASKIIAKQTFFIIGGKTAIFKNPLCCPAHGHFYRGGVTVIVNWMKIKCSNDMNGFSMASKHSGFWSRWFGHASRHCMFVNVRLKWLACCKFCHVRYVNEIIKCSFEFCTL